MIKRKEIKVNKLELNKEEIKYTVIYHTLWRKIENNNGGEEMVLWGLETHREVLGERKKRERENVLFVVFQYKF
jgi:hypothetical protein